MSLADKPYFGSVYHLNVILTYLALFFELLSQDNLLESEKFLKAKNYKRDLNMCILKRNQ